MNVKIKVNYMNPWFKSTLVMGPEFYERQPLRSVDYSGYQIYKIHDHQWDVVKDGVCRTQVVTLRYAKEWIDTPITDDVKGYWCDHLQSLVTDRVGSLNW